MLPVFVFSKMTSAAAPLTLYPQHHYHHPPDMNMETLHVLYRQEASSYHKQKGLPEESCSSNPKLLEWFQTMTQWCITVAECCNMSMETVEIAMNLLHRYYSDDSSSSSPSSSDFQLATMTCLYIASKTNATKSLTPTQLERLGRQQISASDIEQMERTILQALEWKINPPTTNCFTKYYLLLLLQMDQDDDTLLLLLNLVEAQTKYAIAQLYWLQVSPSQIALASLLNAMDLLNMDQEKKKNLMQEILPSIIENTHDTRIHHSQLQTCLLPIAKENAYSMIHVIQDDESLLPPESTQSTTTTTPSKATLTRGHQSSPTTVVVAIAPTISASIATATYC